MTREEAIIYFKQCNSRIVSVCKDENEYDYEKQEIISDCARKTHEANRLALKALEQKPRKGQWLRISDLSEQEDDRYKCSYCGNVIHHKSKMNLYTFNSWCGRCGSYNGMEVE